MNPCTVMRTTDGEKLLPPPVPLKIAPKQQPLPPSSVPSSPLPSASTMSAFMPMPAGAGTLSPDDMLRAYAVRRNGPLSPGAGDRKSFTPTEASSYSMYGPGDVYGGTA